jgi:hypothetical protein
MKKNSVRFKRLRHAIGLSPILVATLLILCSSNSALAQTNFAMLNTDGGWCWFSDPRALFHNGKLYYGYVKSNGKTALDVFDPSTGSNTNLWSSGFTQIDDHNVPGLCVKSDGRLLAIYARHLADEYFAYRTSNSTNPVTSGDWNAEQQIPDSGSAMTYANPFQLTNEGGKIYNFSRNLNFNPTVYTSTDGGSSWSSGQILIQSGSGTVRPYVKYCSDGAGRIDFNYTDGHPRNEANSLYHMFYQGGSLYKTDGTLIKSFGILPLDHDSGERGSVIYQYSASDTNDFNVHVPTGRAWCWENVCDTNGYPVSVFQVQVDGSGYASSRIFYYYARWTGTGWQKRFIAQAGRALYSVESDYGGGICVDPENPNVIYLSSNAQYPFDLTTTTNFASATNVPLAARYEIYKGVTTNGGLSFTWSATTTNSTMDNCRPYIPRRNGGEPCVLWWRGTYSTYSSFNTAIVGLFTTVTPQPLPQPPINYIDASSGAGGNTKQWDGNSQSWVTWTPPLNITSTADNQWEEESGAGLGNGPTSNWFESNREGTEDCPQLRTLVQGLNSGTYNVFAYFWVANGQGFKFGAALTNNPNGSLPIYAVGSTGVKAAVKSSFATTNVTVASADRDLYQVSLGTVTGSSVAAYIDDDANGGYSSSCWYDGIGYQLQLAQTPANILAQKTVNDVVISWPESHRGWLLQSTANITGTWTDVAGSSTNTSHMIVAANAPSPRFFRLRYPIP